MPTEYDPRSPDVKSTYPRSYNCNSPLHPLSHLWLPQMIVMMMIFPKSEFVPFENMKMCLLLLSVVNFQLLSESAESCQMRLI